MTDVFISYSSKDEDLAQTIRERLEAKDIEVFLATKNLKPGQKWADEIQVALRETKWVFVLFTESSKESAPVLQEIGGALYGKKKIVPIVYGVDFDTLPRWLGDYQGVSVRADNPDDVVKKIDELAGQVAGDLLKNTLLVLGFGALLLYLFSKT